MVVPWCFIQNALWHSAVELPQNEQLVSENRRMKKEKLTVSLIISSENYHFNNESIHAWHLPGDNRGGIFTLQL